ncbi:MAG: hypothetical protein WCC95_11905 [Candidatus Sulfotelmatobacter sp.]|jgi:hypothetical protein
MSFFRFFLLPCSLMIASIATGLAAQSVPIDKAAATNAPTTSYSGQLGQPLQVQPSDPDGPRECLKMRMYKVRRDDPQSDSTHLVKYSTCLPTARIQTYRVEQPAHVKMP